LSADAAPTARATYHKIVVFDDGALVDRVLEEDVERVSQRQHHTVAVSCACVCWVYSLPVQKHLILLGAAHDVEHHIRLHLEDDDFLIVQDDIRGLLGRFLWGLSDNKLSSEEADMAPTEQPLLKGLLVLHRLVCDLAGVVGRVARGRMRVRIVLGEDARAIVDGENQDRRHAEQGEGARHGVVEY
jgi:hypothetical protein